MLLLSSKEGKRRFHNNSSIFKLNIETLVIFLGKAQWGRLSHHLEIISLNLRKGLNSLQWTAGKQEGGRRSCDSYVFEALLYQPPLQHPFQRKWELCSYKSATKINIYSKGFCFQIPLISGCDMIATFKPIPEMCKKNRCASFWVLSLRENDGNGSTNGQFLQGHWGLA